MSEEIKIYKVTEPWLETSCGLAEAPFWEKSRNGVRFVDIVKQHLYFVDLEVGAASLKRIDLDYSISTTADIEGEENEFVFGGKYGYGIFDRRSGKARWIKKMWNDEERESNGGKSVEERMRSNDGAVDANGRYWVGTMNDPMVIDGDPGKEGVLFRLDSDLSIHRLKTGLTIPNGISWTDDNKTIFMTDSPSGEITSYPYNSSEGTFSDSASKPFFKTPFEDTVPDGHCQDAEGFFWVAIFGGGKVVRVNPQGAIVAEVHLPTRCISCPVLCGTNLVVTSAEEEAPEKFPDSVKYQGAVFKVDVGVGPGRIYDFKMTAKA